MMYRNLLYTTQQLVLSFLLVVMRFLLLCRSMDFSTKYLKMLY